MAVMLSATSITPACSEDELIDLARDGDDRAFEELYSRYRERIGSFIIGRVHDHGRAEDIAQEVFMSALRRLRSSEQAIAFKPWIYEIAKNACIDEFRRNRRSREVSLDADDELTGGPQALSSIAPTPPAAVESRQRLNDLRGAFGGLSESHHQLLVMREFEGLSYEEIASRTGMSRQMVESVLFRARRKLAEEYEELASGRRCQQVQTLIDDQLLQSRRSLGIRQRRQLARHLAHCQPCRMTAHLAGVDEALLRPRSIADKIAVLFPFGLWRWPWRRGGRSGNALHRTGAHPFAVHSAQNAATVAGYGGASSLGGAAIAAAVIAVSGAGGVVVAGLAGRGHAVAPAAVSSGGAAARGATGSDPKRSRAPVRRAAAPRSSHPASLVRPSLRRTAKSSATGDRHGSGPGAPPSHGATSGSGSGGSSSTGSGTALARSTVSQTAKRATDAVTSGAQNTVKRVTNTVDGATKTVTGTVNQATGAVAGAVNQATGGATGGVTGVVKKATGGVTGAVDQATGGATGAVDNTVQGATGTVGGVVHGLTGSL